MYAERSVWQQICKRTSFFCFYLRQHRTIGVCELRSKIFRQGVQKNRRLAGASQGIFVQADGTRFKQGVRRDLCGVALIIEKPVRQVMPVIIDRNNM